MAQIQNFGFIASIQEPDFQHAARPCGGIGKLGRKPESPEHALCHTYHTGTHGQGLGGYVPVRHNHFQQPDGIVPALQVSAPEGTGTAGYSVLRRMGGDFCKEDDRL